MKSAERYPLTWPEGWKRTTYRVNATFGKTAGRSISGGNLGKKRLSIEDAFGRIEEELERHGVDTSTVIVSTNLKTNMRGMPSGAAGEPGDPGVAVYWIRKGKPQCMAIDGYTRVADNLAAVAATLDAMRAIERHGGAAIMERAFLGFAQLPETTDAMGGKTWRQILEIDRSEVDQEHINFRSRELLKVHHPDAGGDRSTFEAIIAARAVALKEVLK